MSSELEYNPYHESWPGQELLNSGKELPKLPARPDRMVLTLDHARSYVIMNSQKGVLAWYPAGYLLNDRESDWDTEKLEDDIRSEMSRRGINGGFSLFDMELSKAEQVLLSEVQVDELISLTGGVSVSSKESDFE
ncbi:TPA: hypothetical protein DIU27_03310 [Candidatus Collierbacteria bacterium]|uniref:Uncharacterized protein n=1 Tax=Candidatus Collierbacteria bacterium GW2011_GWB2_44_22 TaxID=1618387 RepID=A0A0G1KWD1_9BACT|nr:MAG: hypothetical protein UW31_C0001G0015 [Candidatus Collierbacteria bacterium GW2011_GWA2_44_13]KKT52219.1 MAG: hypothetical protein UW44_C0003G0062 [Candidatus Collierbacteria bacterium GW2011_GWB2_44_22]KKT62417.1 MAG: hypothetical protein UW56_C0007G0025 [Candidatus Collierbacteria bacterium GW2011_GWD1_44_27]KKT66839.1 MAG: hypothetical protein UW58_C0002G0024 [Candidatus Collierbacteria bacterium GW2011_GWC2_44_30]KKT69103.1 MAG: hypothetical protein UW64_C0004G0025 [Microgenomates gr